MPGFDTPPPARTATVDLTDAEFAELDELLAQTPDAYEPLDVVMLDGYLCGVLVQPVLLAPATWLAHVYDEDGRPLPDDVDPAWRQRCDALILRRHAALHRALSDDGWFEPLVLEDDDEAPPDQPEADAPSTPIQRAMLPWVAGFAHATQVFPDLLEMQDDAVMAAVAHIFRHLPPSTDEEREIVALFDREVPLTTLDDAIDELVGAVCDLHDLTSEQRFRVETVRRETPKVGRNDPCPCGSGRKFKLCHGAS
ncbi:MAG: UPF0149 family protein [Proteobacteria bacterium]|nr:UPF0149 family protein [Pseudomonadota bacterium]